MKWFSNLNITKKLFFGFGLVIILTIFLAIVSIFIVKNINESYDHLNKGSNTAITLLNEATLDFTNARLDGLYISHYSSNLTKAKEFYDKFSVDIINSINKLDQLVNIIKNESSFKDDEIKLRLDNINNINTLIKNYYIPNVNLLFDDIENNNSQKINSIIIELGQNALQAQNLLNTFVDSIKNDIKTRNSTVAKQATSNIILLSLISAFIIIISSISAVFIAKVIKKPIVELSKFAKGVTEGDFNLNFSTNSKDEIGNLSNDIKDLVNIFKTIMIEINKTSDNMKAGDLDARIDEDKFVGEYKKVVSAINESFHEIISDTEDIIDCVKSYAEGNFEKKSKRYPYKKAIIHENLDTLQNNLNEIHNDIVNLINFASSGNFDIKIELDKYTGDWRKISEMLNNLMTSVETPINEVANVLEKVSRANFSQKINGHYQGQFEVMKYAVNSSIENTSNYINEISQLLTKMSNQDLDISINKEYIGDFKSIKDALVNIIDTFNILIHEFTLSADQVATGSKQISESSMNLAQGSSEQSNAVDNLNTTIGLISMQTSENAKNAKKASELANETKDDGVIGKTEMEKMLQAMDEINRSSLSISKIIKTIEDIAFQTNLLALNAAVEAARAGVHGKGFAVVSEEVRNLAVRSQKATIETAALINNTVDIVAKGTKTANSTSIALNKMLDKVMDIADLVNQVSGATSEQEKAILEINQGIERISLVTNSNTALSEESASSAEELSSQAEIFNNAINMFKLKSN